MSKSPVEYIPFVQTVAPLFKVLQAQAIVETKAWHARQTQRFTAVTQAGLSVHQRFALPRKTPYLAPDASVPEESRGSVITDSA